MAGVKSPHQHKCTKCGLPKPFSIMHPDRKDHKRCPQPKKESFMDPMKPGSLWPASRKRKAKKK